MGFVAFTFRDLNTVAADTYRAEVRAGIVAGFDDHPPERSTAGYLRGYSIGAKAAACREHLKLPEEPIIGNQRPGTLPVKDTRPTGRVRPAPIPEELTHRWRAANTAIIPVTYEHAQELVAAGEYVYPKGDG